MTAVIAGTCPTLITGSRCAPNDLAPNCNNNCLQTDCAPDNLKTKSCASSNDKDKPCRRHWANWACVHSQYTGIWNWRKIANNCSDCTGQYKKCIDGECYEYQCSGCVKKGNEIPPPAQSGPCAQDYVESEDSNGECDEGGYSIYSINW